MPGFATHYFFGEKTIPALSNQRIRNHICKHIHSFCLGLQGPDVFYYSLPAYLSSTGNIGSKIHSHSTLDFFISMMNARNHFSDRESRQIADAYICGFLGHYTLDTYCHPYVFCRTKHMKNQDRSLYDFGRHVFLETAIDQALIRHYRNIKPSDFLPEDTIRLSRKEKHIIARLLQRAISETFPEERISYGKARFAIASMQLESRLMHDPKGWKKILLRRLEQCFIGYAVISPMIPSNTVSIYKDPCNRAHRRWANPWNPRKKSADSVYDLMEQAIPVFCQRICLYFQTLSKDTINSAKENIFRPSPQAYHAKNLLCADLGDCSYNSGLPLNQ